MGKILHTTEVKELQLELLRQWLAAHADHCGCMDLPWPIPSDNNWPMPKVITDPVDPNVVYLLLLEAAGVSVRLQLQATEY